MLGCSCAIVGAATVARALAASREDALEVCLAARQLQGNGRLQVELLTTMVQNHPARANTQMARRLLTGSIIAQFKALMLCLLLAHKGRVLSEFAQQAVPPSTLLPWLRAALAALQVAPLRECLLWGWCEGVDGCGRA